MATRTIVYTARSPYYVDKWISDAIFDFISDTGVASRTITSVSATVSSLKVSSARSRESILLNLPVRFGHDGSKCVIYIGNLTTVWSYPQISISDILVGFSNTEMSKWISGWAVNFTTTLGTITATNNALVEAGIKYSATQPSNPYVGMVWLKPIA